MRFAAAMLCLLLSIAALLLAIDASGSLQDAPPTHDQTRWALPYAAACVLCGAASVWLFVKTARRGL